MDRETRPQTLTVWATRPKGQTALLLAEMGLVVLPIEEDEGPVDRYVLSQRVAVERRTGTSFLQGIVDKTLFTSAIYLQEHFQVPVLILEGQIDYHYTSFNPQAARGALSSMLLLHGVSVLSALDVRETADLIATMARQEQAGIPDISLVPKRKTTSVADMQRRVVEMLPGCGRTVARNLLQHFGSVRRIVNAFPEELRGVRGVGPKTATQIVDVVNAEYAAVDTERDLEDALEVAPELLFEQPVVLLARQHTIYVRGAERNVVDMVFLDPAANELILVELKRGRIECEHEEQIRRYLDHARESQLLGPLLAEKAGLRGILATVTECAFEPQRQDVSVRIVDEARVIRVLGRLRAERLDPGRQGRAQ